MRTLVPTRGSTTPALSTPGIGAGIYAGHLLSVWGIALSNLGLGIAVLWSARQRRRLDWRAPARIVLPLQVYLVWLLVAVAASTHPAASAHELSEVFTLCSLPLGWVLVRGEVGVRRLLDLIIAMTALLAAYGIGQFLFTDYGPLDKRILGPFSHNQTYSGVLLLGELLLVARMSAGGLWRRPLAWLALALLSTAIVLTLTRGTWIAVLVGLTLGLLLRSRRLLVAWLAALAVGAVLWTAFASAGWNERLRSIVDLRDPSNYDRLSMAWAGFHMIAQRPLFGVGPAMVEELYPIYRHPTAVRFHVAHLHNSFLHLAAERGLPTLLAYLWMMGVVLATALRGYRRAGDGSAADLYLGVILALAGFNVAGLFEANWRDTEVQRLVLFVMAVPWCLEGGVGVSGNRR